MEIEENSILQFVPKESNTRIQQSAYKNESDQFFIPASFCQYNNMLLSRLNQIKTNQKITPISKINLNEECLIKAIIIRGQIDEMEDESGRVKIKGNIQTFITGEIRIVKGRFQNRFFFIQETQVQPLYNLEQPNPQKISQGKVVFASGFQGQLQNFTQFIKGNFSNLFFDVERVILCGNCTSKQILEFDQQILELSKEIAVDLMPGKDDNTVQAWPMPAINKIYFPQSKTQINFNSVSNPYKFQLGEREFLGTSGDNIQDMMKQNPYSQNALDYLKQTLDFHYLAPTAPDTLNCRSFEKQDPFVIQSLPQVYFSGNAASFQTDFIRNQDSVCRVFTVPDFQTTNSFVILELNTLDCYEIKI